MNSESTESYYDDNDYSYYSDDLENSGGCALVSYMVVASASALGYGSSLQAYNALTLELSASVQSGNFTRMMKVNAMAYGASNLLNAFAGSVDISQMNTPSPTNAPTPLPGNPTLNPTAKPTHVPTLPPVVIRLPTMKPTFIPGFPTPHPTAMPSFAPGKPTPAPTVVFVVDFDVDQTIAGVTLAEYQSNIAYSTTTQQSAALSIGNGVLPSMITITSVTNSSLISSSRRRLASSGITVNYNVYVPNAAGFSSGSAAYTSMTNSLATATSTGTFTAYMQTQAKSNGATGLATATALSVTITAVIAPTFAPVNAPASSGLSKGGVAGIVIAVIVFVVFMITSIFYLATRKTIIVAGLPPQFSENDLMISLPGAIGVRRLENMICAYVEFETHLMAADLIQRSTRELIYFQNSTLNVRWAYPSCVERFISPSSGAAPPRQATAQTQVSPTTINPALSGRNQNEFGVRQGDARAGGIRHDDAL